MTARKKSKPAGPADPRYNLFLFPDGKKAQARRLTTNDRIRHRLLELDDRAFALHRLLHDSGRASPATLAFAKLLRGTIRKMFRPLEKDGIVRGYPWDSDEPE